MKKTFKLWTEILGSPTKGFTGLNETSPLVFPLIIILILVTASTAMLIPILSSDAYSDALLRVQINTLQERGTELTNQQLDAMEDQLKSERMKRITLISSTVGGAFGYFLMLIISVLILKLIIAVQKEKAPFKLLLRIMVFLALISVVQLIVKNAITLAADYERILSKVQYTADMQYALTAPVSLAALFSPSNMNGSVYYLIDSLTDVFNWIYYVYLFFALRFSVNLEKNKALGATLISAVLMIGVGFVFTLVV